MPVHGGLTDILKALRVWQADAVATLHGLLLMASGGFQALGLLTLGSNRVRTGSVKQAKNARYGCC
jgi:hypothetical protein